MPCNALLQPQLFDALAQQVQITASRLEGHFRLAAPSQRQRQVLFEFGFLRKGHGQRFKQVFNALAAINEAEVQQLQRIKGWHRRGRDQQVAVGDDHHLFSVQAHALFEAIAA